jgi:hypothetical protein
MKTFENVVGSPNDVAKDSEAGFEIKLLSEEVSKLCFYGPKLSFTVLRDFRVRFLYSMFLFHFIMQKLSIISQTKNFNKHVLIDHFHFKHEPRIK